MFDNSNRSDHRSLRIEERALYLKNNLHAQYNFRSKQFTIAWTKTGHIIYQFNIFSRSFHFISDKYTFKKTSRIGMTDNRFLLRKNWKIKKKASTSAMENSNGDIPRPQLNGPKQKLFQLIRENLISIGIHPNLATQPYPFNKRILLRFLVLGSFIISPSTYAFHVAETFFEYTESSYMITFQIVITSTFAITILKEKTLFEAIVDLENLLDSST